VTAVARHNTPSVLGVVGVAIAARRRELGLTQEQLAELSGLHRTYIGSVERGIRNPTVVSLERIATGLSCRPSDLLREAGL
jgi:transcriptional regulator with XRE-family HTH domain